MKTKVLTILFISYIFLIILHFFLVNKENPAILNEPAWDSQLTKNTFYKLCADCHSNETRWPWYSNLPPVSFLVYYDVMEGREHFNISEYRKEDGTKSAYEFKKGEMPLRIYNITHPEVNLTKEERERFIQGLESTFGKYYREKLERNLYNHEEE